MMLIGRARLGAIGCGRSDAQVGPDWYTIDRRRCPPGQVEIDDARRITPAVAFGRAAERSLLLFLQRSLDRVEHLARQERLAPKTERLGDPGTLRGVGIQPTRPEDCPAREDFPPLAGRLQAL